MSNAILVDPNSHLSFNLFCFAIGADTATSPPTYYLEAFEDMTPILTAKASDKTPIPFGRVRNQDLPDPALCNVRLAISRVAHACGAAEVVDRILRDEEDMSERLPNAPGSSTVPELFYFNRRLEALAAEEEKEEGESTA